MTDWAGEEEDDSHRYWLRCIVTMMDKQNNKLLCKYLNILSSVFPFQNGVKIKGEADFKWMITWDINEKIKPEREWEVDVKIVSFAEVETLKMLFFLGRVFAAWDYSWLECNYQRHILWAIKMSVMIRTSQVFSSFVSLIDLQQWLIDKLQTFFPWRG